MMRAGGSRMRIGFALPALLLAGCIPQTAPSSYDPAPPPAWEMRKVTPDARRIPATSYTVRNGDSLRLIAVKTGAGSEAIARANNIPRPYTIQPGQVLRIPAGRYHLVREGETGIAI